MPRRKQARRTTVKDLRSILRLTYEQGLSVRAISERLQISKTSVATYLLRAREAGLSWPLPPIYESEAGLQRALFRRVGRPPQDLSEPEWPRVAQELKRKGVTLTLLWQEYRTAHPDGYGYTWFCEKFAVYQRRANPTFRHRHAAGAAMQTDYAGPTVEVIDPQTSEIRQAQIFVAVLGASSLTFAMASFGQRLPDWIEGQTRALSYFGGVPKAIVCDNLKAGVVKALWFEPTLNQTFAAMAEHYDTTILPTRSRKPRDKGKVEGAVLIVERWILARLRHRRFFNLTDLNTAIGGLLEELNNRPMRHIGKSRRQVFEEIERDALAPLPSEPFEYAEWKTAKVHLDYHVEVDKTFYSVPHRLIGRRVDVRLTYRAVKYALKTRGVNDILIAVVDGLKGFPEAITSVYPQTVVQTCIVHLIRNSLAFVSWKDRKAILPAVKAIYRAENADMALLRLGEFEDEWGRHSRSSRCEEAKS